MIFYGPEPRVTEPKPVLFLTLSETLAAVFMAVCILLPAVVAWLLYS